jgi:gamma-tubulin complex component 5
MAPPVVNTRLTRELVLALIPPLKDDPTVLKQVTDHIAREVKADVQGSSRNTWGEVEGSIAGLARTARVRVQSDLADALDKVTGVLGRHIEKGEAAWEGDMPLKVNFASYLSWIKWLMIDVKLASTCPIPRKLLSSWRGQELTTQLAMSNQPNPKTHDLAHEYLHREPPQIVDHDRMLYNEIMADPFDGEHWGQGYDEEVREGWTDSESSGSDREGERLITPLKERVGVIPSQSQVDEGDGEMKLREAEEKMKNLGDGYWRTGGRVVESREVGEGWRAVSTGGNVASLALAVDGTAKLGVKVSWLSFLCSRLIIGYIWTTVPARIVVCSLWSTGTNARFLSRWKMLRMSPKHARANIRSSRTILLSCTTLQ